MSTYPKPKAAAPGGPSRVLPHPPLHVPISSALKGNETLSSLMQRLLQSQARLNAVRPLLGEGLAGAVQAGPLDEEGWSLLVANAAAAAKLRQLLPHLQEALLSQGFNEVPIRLKVQRR
jgi:hypothetical protein